MYIIIWAFIVKTTRQREFEKIYGPDGAWVEFFKQGEGYIQTELFPDSASARRHFTVDCWTSSAAYDAFRAKNAAEYARLDDLCSELTEAETHIGSFTVDGRLEKSSRQGTFGKIWIRLMKLVS